MAVIPVSAGPYTHVEDMESVRFADQHVAPVVGAVEADESVDSDVTDLCQRVGVIDQHTAVVAQRQPTDRVLLFSRARRGGRRGVLRGGVGVGGTAPCHKACCDGCEGGPGSQFCPM